ncbi:MAG: putative addiction module antidote protein [Kiritimatiellaeota bacterium]|nr:putative addiction module antidote protein [Kiritimatiellota bacterium]
MKTYAWDITEHLRTEEEIAAYLTAVLEEGDPSLLLSAVGDIAKARGMAEIAKNAGVSRSTLYHSFSNQGNPEFTTMMKVIHSLGVKLMAMPQSLQGEMSNV